MCGTLNWLTGHCRFECRCSRAMKAFHNLSRINYLVGLVLRHRHHFYWLFCYFFGLCSLISFPIFNISQLIWDVQKALRVTEHAARQNTAQVDCRVFNVTPNSSGQNEYLLIKSFSPIADTFFFSVFLLFFCSYTYKCVRSWNNNAKIKSLEPCKTECAEFGNY